jgi:hypothetical protein
MVLLNNLRENKLEGLKDGKGKPKILRKRMP